MPRIVRAVSGLNTRSPFGGSVCLTIVTGITSPSCENTVYERAICSSDADRP